jgi:DNA-binding transcriptional regulator GbsR (MarR family)
VEHLRRRRDDPVEVFINGWGRMGVFWGVGKVQAAIQALLYLSSRPLCLDEMARRLKTSRSNISLNARALQDLGVVRKVIIPGDRRDFYAAEIELDKVARRLAAAKKRRELDPALDVVARTIEAARALPRGDDGDPGNGDGAFDTERLEQLKTLMEKIGDILETFIGDKTAGGGLRDAVKTRNT